MVKRPAKVEVLESQRGAETMPCLRSQSEGLTRGRGSCMHTILNEDVETLLDQQGRVKDNEAVTEGQDIVAGASFEEFTDGSL